jgi:hypothetical protein
MNPRRMTRSRNQEPWTRAVRRFLAPFANITRLRRVPFTGQSGEQPMSHEMSRFIYFDGYAGIP